jgi:hypothetical protein
VRRALGAAGTIWRTFGRTGLRQRASFEVRKRLSRLRTDAPVVPRPILDHPLPDRWPFRPDARRVALETQRDDALARAQQVLGGLHHAYARAA